jgi:hypothetical protein
MLEVPSGWLAITPRDHPYRIGVIGDTQEHARRRFVAAFAAWEELHDRTRKALSDGREQKKT